MMECTNPPILPIHRADCMLRTDGPCRTTFYPIEQNIVYKYERTKTDSAYN